MMNKVLDEIRITAEMKSKIDMRFHRILRAINDAFYEIDNDTEHGMYVGSYGRSTAIKTSDIDVLVELPFNLLNRFANKTYNWESYLLNKVKEYIGETYSTTKRHADGQIVSLQFSDGMKFEVLPAFRCPFDKERSYFYCDTNNGGDVKHEIVGLDSECIKGLSTTIRTEYINYCMLARHYHDTYYSSYNLHGIILDTLNFKIVESIKSVYNDNKQILGYDDLEKLIRCHVEYTRENSSIPMMGYRDEIKWQYVQGTNIIQIKRDEIDTYEKVMLKLLEDKKKGVI